MLRYKKKEHTVAYGFQHENSQSAAFMCIVTTFRALDIFLKKRSGS